MAAKRSRSRRRSRPAAEKNELRDNEDDREVWPVLIILIRVMIASWFIYSACDRFLRPGAWDKYIGYQRDNFARMGWSAEDASEGSAEDASEGSRLDLLQVIFFIVTGVELVGAVLFMFGVEKLGIDMLIMYLLFTGIVLHHFWMKGLESSTMHTLAFTQILTVLGLLLYVRETLYQDVPTQRKSFVSHKSKSKTPAVIVETLDVDDDGEEAEVELPPVASKKKKKKKKTSKKGATLERIRQRIDTIDFGTIGTASHDERDDLQRIKGIGPFIEEKLHALEIYTFRQIAAMTPVIEDNVNIAIEFFIGRIRRDEWRRQAQEFVDENGYD